MLQVAKGRYAPEDYHNFIGFEVSAPAAGARVLETYGLNLKDVMPNEQLAINTYRRSVSQIIPEMTKVALLVKGDQLTQGNSQLQSRAFSLSPVEGGLQKIMGLGLPATGRRRAHYGRDV